MTSSGVALLLLLPLPPPHPVKSIGIKKNTINLIIIQNRIVPTIILLLHIITTTITIDNVKYFSHFLIYN